MREDFEEAVVFSGRGREEEAFDGGACGDLLPVLLSGGFVLFPKAGDVGDEDGLGLFAAEPVVAAFAAGGAAEDGVLKGHVELPGGAAKEDAGALAGPDFFAGLDVAVAHDETSGEWRVSCLPPWNGEGNGNFAFAGSILPHGAVFGFVGLVFGVEGDFAEAAFAGDGAFAEAPCEGVYFIHEGDDFGGCGDAAEAVGEVAFIEAASEVVEDAGVCGKAVGAAPPEIVHVGHAGIASRPAAQAMQMTGKSAARESAIDFALARGKRGAV